jgi:hypothetical protein
MKVVNSNEAQANIPVFATTSGAACYKVGEETFVDMIFMRSHFVVSSLDNQSNGLEQEALKEQPAEMVFTKVGSITMTAHQAKELMRAVQHQLDLMAGN